MSDLNIILPTKPRVVSENENQGSYEIEGLYPGYGQTLGNSLRRIILSSMVGTAITSLKIKGASHEFSTVPGVKEDGIMLILNLKKVHFKMSDDGPHTVTLKAKGVKTVTAGDLDLPGQLEVSNPKQHLATLTEKNAELEIELVVERGLGYLPKEALGREKNEIGNIVLDSTFTPIRRVSYEVENMRVGDRTDYNRLRLNIETDGTISPREALEQSVKIMIRQLSAIVGFREEETAAALSGEVGQDTKEKTDTEHEGKEKVSEDILKTRIDNLDLSSRAVKALTAAGIRTLGGLARKKASDLEEVEGLGDKAIEEIKKVLQKHDLAVKE
ncbi:MAG: DNA-directed RNA polymerase subunit alpha [Patescibacteria group bacterium]